MRKSKTNIVKKAISEAEMRARRVKIKVGKKEVTFKIDRKSGFLYYVKGSPLSIYKVKMQHKGRTKSTLPRTLVKNTPVIRDSKYLYYISSDNYLSRTKRKGVD
ncbi:hypothetical protein KAW18_01895 [candidate division WOR-3 bacterium]|nr:hypothetical protein [candidate division WOR-3 bacterium]